MGWVELLFPPYFVNVFTLDKLHIDTARDRAFIGDGNISAHHGDPTVDARLYLTNGRQDDEVFTELYGLNPVRVSFIEHPETLSLLATIKSSKFRMATARFYQGFNIFIERFKISNCDTNYLMRQTDVTQAYWEVWRLHGTEISEV